MAYEEDKTIAGLDAAPSIGATDLIPVQRIGQPQAERATVAQILAGGAAPSTASFVVFAADGTLTNEKVLGTDVVMRGLLASRPAASVAGRLYVVTDSGSTRWTRDNGSSWDDVLLDWSQIPNKPSTFAPSAHSASHKHGGSDEIASASAAANVIPKAGADGTIASDFLPAATTSARGAVMLAANGGVASSTVIQASDMRLASRRAWKSADESVASSTTPQADNHLTVLLSAGTYLVEIQAWFACNSAGGVKFGSGGGFSPVSARWMLEAFDADDASLIYSLLDFPDYGSAVSLTGSTGYVVRIKGTVEVAVESTLGLYWAQAASNASVTQALKGSHIYAEKLA